MIELQPKHYDLIMDCLDEFDFERVQRVMTFLDWKYADSKEVPDAQYLRKKARKYLIEAAKEALQKNCEFTCSTGGFRYEAKLYPDNFVWLRMSFIIEEWDNAE
jgi:hypothetical protein